MLDKITIHIGHGKTGTSYLQSFLALNRENFLKYGIDYPKHSSFLDAKMGNISSGNGLVLSDNFQNIEKISKKNKLIFSNENFYHDLLGKKSNEFKSFSEVYGTRIKIILYTRNLFSQIFSTWAQTVKRSLQVNDLNYFLKNFKPLYHKGILDWIDHSKQFGMEIIIRNYSKNKSNLLNCFIEDALGEEFLDAEFNMPLNKQINRSLTFLEYEIQRIFNYLELDGTKLSDKLVNQLPDLEASKLKCSIDAYSIFKERNYKVISQINNLIDSNQSIIIESPEEVVYRDYKKYKTLSNDHLEIISSYIKTYIDKEMRIKNNKYVEGICKISFKISRKEELTLRDAYFLMKVAQNSRPQGKIINKTISKWKELLDGDSS